MFAEYYEHNAMNVYKICGTCVTYNEVEKNP